MSEIIGAIIGALLGGFFMWLFSRKQPTHIVCEQEFTHTMVMGLPETRILYRDIPLRKLHMLRLRARNPSTKVIEKPEITFQLSEDTNIIGVTSSISPQRGTPDSPCQTSLQDSEVRVSLDRIYPYSLNKETAIIDLFSDAPISVLGAFGSGVLGNGSGWSVLYQEQKDIPPRETALLIFTAVNFFSLLIGTIAYLLWRPPSGVVSLNTGVAQVWLSDPLLWVLLGWIAAFILWAFAMGLHGWILPIPMPFLGRAIHIFFVKTRED